jgi:hypothetical protein
MTVQGDHRRGQLSSCSHRGAVRIAADEVLGHDAGGPAFRLSWRAVRSISIDRRILSAAPRFARIAARRPTNEHASLGSAFSGHRRVVVPTWARQTASRAEAY